MPATVARTAPDGRTVTVLQANLKVGSADPQALVRTVREHRVDVLATEELTTAAARRLTAAGLARTLPYRYLRPLPDGGSGTGIWSRWPLSDERDLDGFYLGTVRATAATPDGPLSVVAVHLTPPWPFPVRRWLDEVPRLRALLREQPSGPVIAPGDYNATTGHAQFRSLLADGYRDAIDDAGAGYLPSYPNDRWYGPVIGIDHVLVRGATGTSARTLELPASDHRALLVQVVIPRER
ncbi:endonuclease/exonuclease/phosphatase family protein [Jatrophihabitans fulvus]